MDEQDWLEETRERAEEGDARAILDLAFTYQRGRLVPKDVTKAERLLRQAEAELDEEAWLELLRMLYWERDPRISDVFNERAGQKPSGRACYIFGHYLEKIAELPEDAERVYETGSKVGHVGCSLAHHRLTYLGAWKIAGLPRLLSIFIKGVVVGFRDEDDPRWKT